MNFVWKRKVKFGLLLVAGLLSFHATARAESVRQLINKGNARFSAGQYDEALAAYEEAGVNAPESPHLYFNKGAALYGKGDYAAATDAFQQAALKSRDIALEATSKFNLGLCAIREAERQQDSDLNKALEAFGRSIQYFREALDLDPDFREAAENIEVVRLMMKTILDELKKQEEDAQKQQEQAQKTAEEILALIERQQALLDRNSALEQEAQQNGTAGIEAETQSLADDQGILQEDTQQVADQMAGQQQGGGLASKLPGMQQAANAAPPQLVEHLGESVAEQAQAVDLLKQIRNAPADEHQQKSLEALKNALESMSDPQQQQDQQQNQQGQQDQQQGQQNQDQQDQQQGESQEQQQSADAEETSEEEQQASAMQSPDDAESILDEEKANNIHRAQQQAPGGYREVSRDW